MGEEGTVDVAEDRTVETSVETLEEPAEDRTEVEDLEDAALHIIHTNPTCQDHRHSYRKKQERKFIQSIV